MAKFKFPVSELNECWWLDTADCVMAGYTYRRHRVFVVCAKNRALKGGTGGLISCSWLAEGGLIQRASNGEILYRSGV